MIETWVFQKDGVWWFRWQNTVGKVQGGTGFPRRRDNRQEIEPPYETKAEAEEAMQGFMEERKKKYPSEIFKHYSEPPRIS